MTATTSKLGAAMTDEEIEALAQQHFARYEEWRVDLVAFSRALLARQPAAIDNKAVSMRCPRGGGSCSVESCLEESACTLSRFCAAPSVEQDERGALMRCPFCGGKAEYKYNSFHGDDSMAVCSCCGAQAFWNKWQARSASPAAPLVEQDEREAFEAWWEDDDSIFPTHESDPSESHLATAWQAWQARAASTSANVAQKLVPVYPQGVMGIPPYSPPGSGSMTVEPGISWNAANVAQGAEHPDDIAVDRFAVAMKEKLAAARNKGRGGWEQCEPADLSRMLREHVEKGDPRDVANFCMMLWHHSAPIAPPAQPALTDDARDAARYRWLRRRAFMLDESDDSVTTISLFKAEGPAGEFLDDQIDAALTAAQSASGDTK